jgi:nucleoside-diphosphate-sugar epimerase
VNGDILDALIVGGNSRIGHALFNYLEWDMRRVMKTTRKPAINHPRFVFCDLENPPELPAARVTYLLAGITSFKECAADVGRAERINADGHIAIAVRQLAKKGKVVFASSSAVEHQNLSIYAATKLKVEFTFMYDKNFAAVRFGPVKKPGRDTYADGDYAPVELVDVVKCLASYLDVWTPGVQKLTGVWTDRLRKEVVGHEIAKPSL